MILLNDFKRQWEEIREDALAAFSEVGGSGWYILGREVRDFEQALASYWGITHAVGVASGLDAIEIALRCLGCRPGDQVLTTPLSAFPTTLAVIKLGAVPVFADTDEFGLIDLDQCRSILISRPDIRFFLPVHLYGHALHMGRLAALREESGSRLVEDCAQSIGSSHNGIASGTAAQISTVSFYPTKNLGALGDGGAVLTHDAVLAESARCLRDYGQSSRYRHDVAGYNSRLDELHAGYLHRVCMKRLPGWTEARRRVAASYLGSIRNPAIRMMGAPPGSQSCWHLFPVLVDGARKADFMVWLKSRGIASAEHYPVLIPDQRALAGVPFEVIGDLAAARRICRSEVSLPIHPYLTGSEIAQVCDACNAWPG